MKVGLIAVLKVFVGDWEKSPVCKILASIYSEDNRDPQNMYCFEKYLITPLNFEIENDFLFRYRSVKTHSVTSQLHHGEICVQRIRH